MPFPSHGDYHKPAEDFPPRGLLPRYSDLAVGVNGKVSLAESGELAPTQRLFAQGLSFKTSD